MPGAFGIADRGTVLAAAAADGGTDGPGSRGRGHHHRALHRGPAPRTAWSPTTSGSRRRCSDQLVGGLPGRGRARVDPGRRGAARARRRVPLERPRRPAALGATRDIARAARQAAGVRHLPRAPDLVAALGASTFKLPFGHHGGNHPVRNLADRPGRDHEPEPQLRGRRRLAPGGATVTHLNLNDGDVEGMRAGELRAFSVQYHPEAGPGPHDARYLFDEFTILMRAVLSRCRAAPTSRRSCSSERARSSSARRASSTTPVRRRAACCAKRASASCSSNSNPATIMTDPRSPTHLRRAARRSGRSSASSSGAPDALLPTLGGQTGLNLAMELAERGRARRLQRGDDRRERRGDPHRRGPAALQGRDDRDRPARPASGFAYTLDEALAIARPIGYPVIVRPAYILGGGGTGIAHDRNEMRAWPSGGSPRARSRRS